MTIISNEYLKVTINEKGAELHSITDSKREFLYDGDPKYWARRAPILFPIVGSLNDNEYTYDNVTYTLNQHGFARDKVFQLLEKTDTYASFILTDDEDTLKVYPFTFFLVVDYLLKENELIVTYKVINSGEKPIYYQIGAHPAFNLKKDSGYKIELINSDKKYELNDNGKIKNIVENDKDIFMYENSIFDNDALIYSFKTDEKIVKLYENNLEYITIDFSELNLLGIWTPAKANAPFICLEPWNGIADYEQRNDKELINKDFVNKLDKDSSDVVSYKIIINGVKK